MPPPPPEPPSEPPSEPRVPTPGSDGPEPEPEPEEPEPSRGVTRFVPHVNLMMMLGCAALLVLAAVLNGAAKRREAFVEDVRAVAIAGRSRLARCGAHGAEAPVPVRLELDGQGGAAASVEGPLAGTVSGRCIEEELSQLRYPRARGLPVTVELSLDAR